MAKKFQFVGGSRDGESIDLGREHFEIDFAVTLNSMTEPSVKGTYRIKGDGKFHFQEPVRKTVRKAEGKVATAPVRKRRPRAVAAAE